MKAFLIASCLLLVATPASAISRYNSERLSCARVQSIIKSEGAAIMRYQSRNVPGLPLYDRYVAHSGYCDSREYAGRVTIPSADTPRCPVLKCFPINDDFMDQRQER